MGITVMTNPPNMIFLILVICVLSFYLVSLARTLTVLLFLCKKQTFILLIFSIFLVIIILIFVLILITSFIFFTLGLCCTMFPTFQKWKLRLSILHLSHFLIYAFHGKILCQYCFFHIPHMLISHIFNCM